MDRNFRPFPPSPIPHPGFPYLIPSFGHFPYFPHVFPSIPGLPMPQPPQALPSTILNLREPKRQHFPGVSFDKIKVLITEVVKLRYELSSTLESLKFNRDSTKSKSLLEKYENSKKLFSKNLEELVEKNSRLSLKISKRKRHRNWKKRQSERKQLLLEDQRKRRSMLHEQIDNWRAAWMIKDKDKRQAEEKSRAELKVRRDLQNKRNEVNRLSLMAVKLEELRKLRRQKLKKGGHFFPEEDDEFFRTLQESNSVEASTALDNSACLNHDTNTEEDKIIDYYSQGEKTLKNLLNIRRQWDCFLSSPGSANGSPIPAGPILPSPPSSSQWELYLFSAAH